MICSSRGPDAVEALQRRIGISESAKFVEERLAEIATRVVDNGARRLIVAGGETAGAVVQALGIEMLQIGPQIAPGVPWTTSVGEPRLALALKSGNFGGDEFFLNAIEMLE